MDVLYHGIKIRCAYDFPLCFPHELIIMSLKSIHNYKAPARRSLGILGLVYVKVRSTTYANTTIGNNLTNRANGGKFYFKITDFDWLKNQ